MGLSQWPVFLLSMLLWELASLPTGTLCLEGTARGAQAAGAERRERSGRVVEGSGLRPVWG